MTGTTWQHRLHTAHTAPEVLGVARDFLAAFDPVALHALPEACRPPARLYEDDDISAYAFELVRYECAEGDTVAELVHRLAAFFSHASIRLSQIRAQERLQA